MSEATVPLGRAWNSWNSERPAEMSYLPLGLSLTPCVYASSANSFTAFPAGRPGVRLGPRAIDGSSIALDLDHAGTTLAWRYDKPDPFTLRGHWQARRFGEWGLRFWVLLVLRLAPPSGLPSGLPSARDPAEWTYDPAEGVLAAGAPYSLTQANL